LPLLKFQPSYVRVGKLSNIGKMVETSWPFLSEHDRVNMWCLPEVWRLTKLCQCSKWVLKDFWWKVTCNGWKIQCNRLSWN